MIGDVLFPKECISLMLAHVQNIIREIDRCADGTLNAYYRQAFGIRLAAYV